MDWYIVVKKIKGRQYRYWQRTYRDGPAVRTENQYIGPVRPLRLLKSRVAPISARLLPFAQTKS